MREAVRSRLRAQIPSTAIDWNMSAQAAPPPRIVLWQISGTDDYTLDGPSDYARARVQADCYAATYAAAVVLARQVKAALGGYRGGDILGAFVVDERDKATDTGGGETVAGVSLDFMIHYKG